MRSTLSLLGLYQDTPDLFDNFQIPAGLNKNVLVDNLLMETAELEISITNPRMLRYMIGAWSNKEMYVWQRLYDIDNIDYNPLYSSYREEIRKHDENRTLQSEKDSTQNLEGSNTTTRDLQSDTTGERELDSTRNTDRTVETNYSDNVETSLSHSGDNTATTNSTLDSNVTFRGDVATTSSQTVKESRVAFNEPDLVLHNQTETTGNNDTNTDNLTVTAQTATETQNGTESFQEDGKNTGSGNSNTVDTVKETLNETENNTQAVKDTEEIDGTNKEDVTTNMTQNDNERIGWTTGFEMKGSGENNSPQQLLTEEREFRLQNIYDIIISSFKKRFCILVY